MQNKWRNAIFRDKHFAAPQNSPVFIITVGLVYPLLHKSFQSSPRLPPTANKQQVFTPDNPYVHTSNNPIVIIPIATTRILIAQSWILL